MELLGIRYRGREASLEEVSTINRILIENPTYCRSELSRKLCADWNWRHNNGVLIEQVCRSYLLLLERRRLYKITDTEKCSKRFIFKM